MLLFPHQYDTKLEASTEAYLMMSTQPTSTAEELINLLEPMDLYRHTVLLEIVRIRQSMINLLSDAQWQQVFS